MTTRDVYSGSKWPTREPSGPFRKSIEKWRRADEEARAAAAMAGRFPMTRRPLERYENDLYRSAISPVPDTSTGLLRNISQGASGERWPEFVARYKPVLEYYLGGMAKADPRLTRDLWDDIELSVWVK